MFVVFSSLFEVIPHKYLLLAYTKTLTATFSDRKLCKLKVNTLIQEKPLTCLLFSFIFLYLFLTIIYKVIMDYIRFKAYQNIHISYGSNKKELFYFRLFSFSEKVIFDL